MRLSVNRGQMGGRGGGGCGPGNENYIAYATAKTFLEREMDQKPFCIIQCLFKGFGLTIGETSLIMNLPKYDKSHTPAFSQKSTKFKI